MASSSFSCRGWGRDRFSVSSSRAGASAREQAAGVWCTCRLVGRPAAAGKGWRASSQCRAVHAACRRRRRWALSGRQAQAARGWRRVGPAVRQPAYRHSAGTPRVALAAGLDHLLGAGLGLLRTCKAQPGVVLPTLSKLARAAAKVGVGQPVAPARRRLFGCQLPSSPSLTSSRAQQLHAHTHQVEPGPAPGSTPAAHRPGASWCTLCR